MNKGKCEKCQKTVYDQEGVTVGPHSEQVYHHRCFTCSNEGCTWKLTYANYCFADGKPWCKNHNPITGTSNAAARSASRTYLPAKSSSGNISAPTAAAVPKKPAGGTTFCGQCGSKNEAENGEKPAFCGNCGTKLEH